MYFLHLHHNQLVLKIKDDKLSFTISIGTKHVSNKNSVQDINLELKKADDKLYKVKTTGKNKVVNFTNITCVENIS